LDTQALSHAFGDESFFSDETCEPSNVRRKNRVAISAETFASGEHALQFQAPIYPKSTDEALRIRSILHGSWLFQALDDEDIKILIPAMSRVTVDHSNYIIRQGEEGNCLFLIDSGALECFREDAGQSSRIHLKECTAGDVIGELALLYNAPRAASIIARTECKLWRLDRPTFQFIMRSGSIRRREKYELFMRRVPLFSQLDAYDISQIMEAIIPRDYYPGETIIKEGESGAKTFFILESGHADAFKGEQLVLRYEVPGEYFGELALMNEAPRSATIIASSAGCRVLTIDGESFNRLIGNLEELHARKYS